MSGREVLVKVRKRKIKLIEISPEMLLQFLIIPEGGEVIDGIRITVERDSIPGTATALRCGISEYGTINLIIEDESFDAVTEGTPVPRLEPWYKSEKV